MNLNSYLGLMGKSFREAGSPDGRVLNQTTGDSYTTVTPRAASARRSSVGLNTQSLVNQAPRGLQPPSQPEPGALAPGGDFTNVMHCDLVQTDDARATLRIANADFIIVLDADSLILPEYSLHLLHFITRPGNERVAGLQTPYTSLRVD